MLRPVGALLVDRAAAGGRDAADPRGGHDRLAVRAPARRGDGGDAGRAVAARATGAAAVRARRSTRRPSRRRRPGSGATSGAGSPSARALGSVVIVLALLLPPGDSLEARGGLAAFLFALGGGAARGLDAAAAARLLAHDRADPGRRADGAGRGAAGDVGGAAAGGRLPRHHRLARRARRRRAADRDRRRHVVLGERAAHGRPRVAAARDQARAARDPACDHRRRVGVRDHAGLVASVALLGAMVLSANPGEATGAIADSLEASAPGEPPAGFGSMDDEALGRAYAPLLLFSKTSRWSPVSVDDYVSRAGDTLKIRDWEKQPVERAELPTLTDCPTIVPVPCYTITTDCTDGDAACAQPIAPPSDGERREDGTVHVRVIRRGAPRPDRSPERLRCCWPLRRCGLDDRPVLVLLRLRRLDLARDRRPAAPVPRGRLGGSSPSASRRRSRCSSASPSTAAASGTRGRTSA